MVSDVMFFVCSQNDFPQFAHRVAQLDIALHKVIYFALTQQMRRLIRSRELTWGFRMLKLGIFLSCMINSQVFPKG